MRTIKSGETVESTSGAEERDFPGIADQLPLLADFGWHQWEEIRSYVQAVLPSLFQHCCLKGEISNEG